LIARASCTLNLVLNSRLLAVAVQSGLLAAGALGFAGAEAAFGAAAAGCWDGGDGGRHYDL